MGLWASLSYPFRRRPRRPLADRRPGRADLGQERATPLGMEATDLSLIDRVSRQNDALERTALVGRPGQGGSFAAAASTKIDPMPEDETYAARYHRAYIKKDS
ncbi:MAG: hypothetical protein AAFQ19_17000 [Pseudomonadota bacterium]